MSDETKRSEPVESVDVNEDEIDLLELARTIWKGRKLIIWIVCAFTLATIIYLFL